MTSIFGASLGLHAVAFAVLSLLSVSSLKALDLHPQNLEVEIGFFDTGGSGQEPSLDTAKQTGQPTSASTPAKPVFTKTPENAEPEVATTSVIEAAPSSPEPTSSEGQTGSSEAATAATGAASGSGGGQGGMGVGPGSAQGLARSWLQGVGNLIFSNAARHYPAKARQAHIEGTVALAITIDGLGKITQVQIKRSSGHDVLDQAALAAVQAIHSVPAPPARLQWQPRALTLPIVYRLH